MDRSAVISITKYAGPGPGPTKFDRVHERNVHRLLGSTAIAPAPKLETLPTKHRVPVNIGDAMPLFRGVVYSTPNRMLVSREVDHIARRLLR